jgi:hypothetical protein
MTVSTEHGIKPVLWEQQYYSTHEHNRQVMASRKLGVLLKLGALAFVAELTVKIQRNMSTEYT